MKTRFYSLIIIFEIVLISFIGIGIFIANKFFSDNVILFKSVFTFLLVNLTVAVFWSSINRQIHKLSINIQTIVQNIDDPQLKAASKAKSVFNIFKLYDTLQIILKKCQDYIKRQDKLLKEYSLLNKRLEKSNRIRDVILELSHSITEIDNLEELFNLILERAIEVIDDADKGSILVLSKDNILEFKAAVGYDIEKLKAVNITLERTFLWNASNGNIKGPCIIRNVKEFDKLYLEKDNYDILKNENALDFQTTLSSPIIINGELFGMLNIDSFDENAFDEQDISLMEYFANQAGTAIKNHQLIEKILYFSRYDCLTNVYNRHYFEEIFSKFFINASRYNETFCLVVFDLNGLKRINDTYGHAVGDIVIQTFAKTLENSIRVGDLFARYGGDEFIGVFFNSSEANIRSRMISIMDELKRNPIKANGTEIIIKFSFGIANFPNDGTEIDTLFRVADERMYKLKKEDDFFIVN